MCGIFGFINKENKITDVSSLNDAATLLYHRGPDNFGFLLEKNVYLAHTRLSIQDQSEDGNQPMTCDTSRVSLIFNGEIYNFRELKHDLSVLGYTFISSSDTEVLLKSYLEYGIEFLDRIKGMFAITILDKRSNKLYLIRDRLGIKPLYYIDSGDSFIFSSEIKSIQSLLSVEKVCNQAMVEYWWYGNSIGEKTLYKNIMKLPPGQIITYDIIKHDFEKRAYWSISECVNRKHFNIDKYDAAKRKVLNLLDSSVKRHLISDAPIGALLSGGIDSGAIVALASKYKPSLSTYTAIFDYDKGVNESKLAKLLADRYKTNHHEMFVSSQEVPEIVTKVVDWHDEPFADAANIPLYMISKELKKDMKVVLQGDGGDEIFGGYNRYKSLSSTFMQGLSFIAKPLYPLLFHSNKLSRWVRYASALSQSELAKKFALLLTVESEKWSPLNVFRSPMAQYLKKYNFYSEYKRVLSEFDSSFADTQKMLYTDTKIILPSTFLEKVDKPTMANSIEVRVPFLDHDLVEYALSIPAHYKVSKSVSKKILRDALEDIIPNNILYGKKQGFGVPYGYWLKTSLKPMFLDLLSYLKIHYNEVFDIEYISKLYQEHCSNKVNHQFILWKVLVFSIWLNKNRISL